MTAFLGKYPGSPLEKSAYQRLSSYFGYQAPKDEAKAFFETYTAKYPDDPYVLSSYVNRIIRDKDNIDRGIELAEKIREQMRYNPSPRFNQDLARLYVMKGDEGKADEVFGPSFMDGQVSQLSFYLNQFAEFWAGQKKHLDSAIEMAELAVKLQPDRWYFRQTAARIYLQEGKDDKALEIFGPAFAEENKGEPNILNSYAWFWAGQGKNMESALAAAKTSVGLAEAAYNWDTLAFVHQKMRNFPEALAAAEKAVALAEGEVKARYQGRIQQIKKEMEKKAPGLD